MSEGGPVTDHKHHVGPGWHPLLDDLHRELTTVNPDYQTEQVKEKFGDLRVYIREAVYGSEMCDIILRYEELSSTVCEFCGSREGKHTSRGWWIKTLCPACDGSRFKK